MEIIGSKIKTAEGKVLRRKSDGWIAGQEIYLGYTYYINGKRLDKPLFELPQHYEEIEDPELSSGASISS